MVFGIVPAGDRPELHSAGALQLAAMGGTSTHALRLDGLRLPDEDVVAADRPRAVGAGRPGAQRNVQPSTSGVALAALDLLDDAGSPRSRPRCASGCSTSRARAYALLDEVDGAERLEERLALRAAALLLAVECCTALLTARGGQGMDLADPAQRLLRAAAFQVVHSQARARAGGDPGRAASRERRPARPGPHALVEEVVRGVARALLRRPAAVGGRAAGARARSARPTTSCSSTRRAAARRRTTASRGLVEGAAAHAAAPAACARATAWRCWSATGWRPPSRSGPAPAPGWSHVGLPVDAPPARLAALLELTGASLVLARRTSRPAAAAASPVEDAADGAAVARAAAWRAGAPLPDEDATYSLIADERHDRRAPRRSASPGG